MINWFKNTYFYLIFIYRPITSGVFSIPRLFANLILYSILFVLIGIFLFGLSLINSEVLEINQLPIKSGIVKNISYNSKNSGGTLSLLLDNNTIQKYEINKSDRIIYDTLLNKKVKVYLEKFGIFNAMSVAGLENEKGDMLIKYNYEKRLEVARNSHNFALKIFYYILFIIFLIYLTNKKGLKPKYFKEKKWN